MSSSAESTPSSPDAGSPDASSPIASSPIASSNDAGLHTSEVIVVLPAHLHARPAGKLARAAAAFSSSVQLECDGKKADVTGVLAVMSLGATAGTSVVVRARGEDAGEAANELAAILRTIE